jgi:hypothetical protein
MVVGRVYPKKFRYVIQEAVASWRRLSTPAKPLVWLNGRD